MRKRFAWFMTFLLCGAAGAQPRQHDVTADPTLQPAARMQPATSISSEGMRLVELLRQGGLVLFFRHADTAGMPCDSSFRVGDRGGQRNLSAQGRLQARRLGERLRELGIAVQRPILAGPVFRARDTAEEAFGAGDVVMTDSLLADDYAGGRLEWVLAEHRRLFATRPREPGVNAVLVGHRTPAIMILGQAVAGRAFPEGAALVLRPGGDRFSVLGILDLVPMDWRDTC